MAADKHFHTPGVVPSAIDDPKPDDMPAARTLGILVIALLGVCFGIFILIYTAQQHKAEEAAPAPPPVGSTR